MSPEAAKAVGSVSLMLGLLSTVIGVFLFPRPGQEFKGYLEVIGITSKKRRVGLATILMVVGVILASIPVWLTR